MQRYLAPVAVLLALVIATSAFAEDKKKKEKKPKGSPGAAMALGMLKNIELTPEQKTQVENIGKSFDEKLMSVNYQLPTELAKARKEATQKAKAEGKKGKELKAAVDAAVPVPAEDKQKLEAAQKQRKELSAALKTAVLGVLTDDQKAKLQPTKGKKKKDAA